MTNNYEPHKSVMDQILDAMFTKLKENEDFNNDAINKLEKLRENCELSKSEKIRNAILPTVEENGENN